MRVGLLAAVAALLSFAGAPASAQHHPGEPSESAPFGSPVADRHVYAHLILDQLEGRFGSDNAFRWDGEAWIGTDTNRLWVKSEAQIEQGRVLHGQHEFLYDRPISSYFDLQAGLRYDLDDGPGKAWAAFGIEGLSQYFFRVSATVYVSDAGNYAAKLLGSFDLLLTQRLILQPTAEFNFYSDADRIRSVAPGLSHFETGLRLRYEITRKFAPYIGIAYDKKFGGTSHFLSDACHASDTMRLAFGVRVWI